MEKEQNFVTDLVKTYALTSQREIVVNNGICLTHPSHLE